MPLERSSIFDVAAARLPSLRRDGAVRHRELPLPASISMLPALPGPVLLAETDAPSEIVTDWPVVRVMLPPEPAPASVPSERLKMPTGLPSLKVPEIEIVSRAVMSILPPRPLLPVPLLICPPLPSVRNPALIKIVPA